MLVNNKIVEKHEYSVVYARNNTNFLLQKYIYYVIVIPKQ